MGLNYSAWPLHVSAWPVDFLAQSVFLLKHQARPGPGHFADFTSAAFHHYFSKSRVPDLITWNELTLYETSQTATDTGKLKCACWLKISI